MDEDLKFWLGLVAVVPSLILALTGLSHFGTDRRREARIKRDLELLAVLPKESEAAKPFLRSIELELAERTAARLVPTQWSTFFIEAGLFVYGVVFLAIAFFVPVSTGGFDYLLIGTLALVGGWWAFLRDRARLARYRTRQRRAIMAGRKSGGLRINLSNYSLRALVGDDRVVTPKRRKKQPPTPIAAIEASPDVNQPQA